MGYAGQTVVRIPGVAELFTAELLKSDIFCYTTMQIYVNAMFLNMTLTFDFYFQIKKAKRKT